MKGQINKLAIEVHKNAIQKGFYDNKAGINIGEKIALIHAEASEALEADRKGKYCLVNPIAILQLKEEDFEKGFLFNVKGSFEEEMADIIIRVLDFCAFKEIDIESFIEIKHKYNKSRPYKHGRKY